MMKSVSIALAAVAVCNIATVSATAQDTVKVVDNPRRVIITEDSLGSHVKVLTEDKKKVYSYDYNVGHNDNDRLSINQSTDWNLKLPFQRSDTTSRHHWSVITSGLYFGWGWNHVKNGAQPLKDYMGHEYEIGMLNAVAIEYATGHGQYISLGFGLDWRHYRMHNSSVNFYKDDSGRVGMAAYPDGATHRSSMIYTFSLQFPLVFRQSIGGDGSFFVGPIMNVNTGAHLNTKYKLDGVKYDLTTGSIGQRKITFDVMGGFSYNNVGLYVRYRPQHVLKSSRGPQFNNISMGVILGF